MVDRRGETRRSLSWVWLPIGAVIYAAIALVLLSLGLEPIRGSGIRLPVWTPVTIAFLVYVVLALASLGRLSVLRALVGFIALAALHVMIVASTGALVNLLAPGGYVRSIGTAVRDFPTLAFAQVVIVPVMLAPLRRVLVPHPRGARSTRPVSSPRAASNPRTTAAPAASASAPARPATGAGIPRPLSPPPPRAPAASPPAASPAPAGSHSPPKDVARSDAPAAAALETPAKDAPRVEAPPPAEPPPMDAPRVDAQPAAPVPPERDRGADRAPAAALAEPARRPSREPLEDVVRISFSRIVEQFPVDAFTLPPDRVAANLLEPNHVLVPQRLLTPQLADGVVHVKWDVIADQFARQALALSDADLAGRLPSEGLKLPLDEIIGQLPAEVYRLSSPAADVRGIEEFPEPFQPQAPSPSLPQQAHAATPEEPTAEPMEPHAVMPPPLVTPPTAQEMDPIAEPMEPHAVAPSPAQTSPIAQEMDPHALPPSPPAPTAQEPEPIFVTPTVEEPEPLEPEPAAVEEPARVVEPAPAPASITASMGPEARVAALLAPSLSTLTVDTVAMDGTMLVVAAAPSLTRADVVETTVRVLPFLTDGRLPAPADQLTVRSSTSAVVITPLGPDATLATVPASSTSLALLERLALRASVQMGSNGVRHRAAAARGDVDRMQDVIAPPDVEALAASLQAFGRVTPTILRDAEGTLLYLFLPSHLDARRLGAFARDLARALTGAALGDMVAATVRFGTQSVVIRTAAGRVAHTTLLVTGGGPTARPGLARLELERAALRLGTH